MNIAEVYTYYTYMQEPDKMMQCPPDGIYVYSTIAAQEKCCVNHEHHRSDTDPVQHEVDVQ